MSLSSSWRIFCSLRLDSHLAQLVIPWCCRFLTSRRGRMADGWLGRREMVSLQIVFGSAKVGALGRVNWVDL